MLFVIKCIIFKSSGVCRFKVLFPKGDFMSCSVNYSCQGISNPQTAALALGALSTRYSWEICTVGTGVLGWWGGWYFIFIYYLYIYLKWTSSSLKCLSRRGTNKLFLNKTFIFYVLWTSCNISYCISSVGKCITVAFACKDLMQEWSRTAYWCVWFLGE